MQCPKDETAWTVVERFDLDIVRVVHDFSTGKSEPIFGSHEAIRSKIATVAPFVMEYSAPTNFEVHRIISMLRRMAKYSERGFQMRNYPRLERSSLVETRSVHWGNMSYVYSSQRRGWDVKLAYSKLIKAFSYLKNYTRTNYVAKGKVEVVGYAPFLLYVATEEREIEKQPSKSVVRFRYTRMIFRPVNHVDVLMFFDDHTTNRLRCEKYHTNFLAGMEHAAHFSDTVTASVNRQDFQVQPT